MKYKKLLCGLRRAAAWSTASLNWSYKYGRWIRRLYSYFWQL